MPEPQPNFVAATATPNAFTHRLFASNPKTLSAVILAWTIVSIIGTTTAYIALRGDTVAEWLQLFRPMLLYYSVWVIVSLLIYRMVGVFSGTPGKRALGVGAHLLLLVAVAVALPFIVHTGSWQTWLYGSRAPGFHTLAAVIYTLNLAGSLLIRFYRLSVARDREAREARLRSSLLENQLNLARMDALKIQINPHFLFNALNSIAALIETDRKPEAYHTTELLGGLLRRALEQSSDRLLTLEQEIDFVQRYVDVEKVRFGSRFCFDVRLDDNCASCEVPALILQPLVENSIKHAVSQTGRDVAINLAASLDNDDLHIVLTDNGPGIVRTDAPSNGLGLENVRKRLQLLYGNAAVFAVSNRSKGGVRATLVLPAVTPSH